jgi:acyl-CoA synthetase (AMP-forming)/AMP-acid ligase II
MPYVSGFLTPVKAEDKDRYIRSAETSWPIFQKYGCLEQVETWGVDIPPGKVTGFDLAVKLEPDEVVVFSWLKWPDKATADAFTPDGWLRTGDLGHRDADGFFFVTGRIKELIIKGGENIAPREIDEALLQHPAVLEAAAVGIPDKHYGQEILACIVPREGMPCTEADLRAFCLEKLGRYKTPGVFRFVTELPRGPSGKVQRLKLAQP